MISEYIDVNGGTIYYESKGKGVPVVLIHAGYLDRRMWDSQFELLSGFCQAVRYDVRGFGNSSGSESSYSDAVDLKSVLDTIEADSAILVGVSNGGRIALDFAVQYPSRVRGLVLMNFGVAGYKGTGPEEEKLWQGMEDIEKKYQDFTAKGNYRDAAAVDVDTWTPLVDEDTRKRLIEIATENVEKQEKTCSEEFLSGKLQQSPQPPAFERLDQITMPVMMILGDQDLPGQVFTVRRMHKLIEGSVLVTIEGADHIASLSKREEFDSVLSGFLEKLGIK